MDLTTMCREIQEEVFAGSVEIQSRMLAFSEALVEQLPEYESGVQQTLLQGLGLAATAMENKDYLLLADVLAFELMPLVAVPGA